MIGLTSLACVTNPVELSAIRIRGTVTSTVDGEPIEGVGVRLGWKFASFSQSGGGGTWGETDAEGKYAITKENVFCTPETFEIGFTIPDGYRLLTDGEYLFVVQCVEDVQVFDFQFEPF
ncbi:MAG: hypothetical protein IH855_07005 [Bacteroidetes bacterium]|nr:hypothetical protein [Bacteroidota bacterium]